MKGERKLYSIQDLYEAIQAAETLGLDYKVIRSIEKKRSFFLIEKEIPYWRFIIHAEMLASLLWENWSQPEKKTQIPTD